MSQSRRPGPLPTEYLQTMRQQWIRTSSEADPGLFEQFRGDLDLMLDLFRFADDLVDRSGSEMSSERIVLRPAVGLDAGLFEWPRFLADHEDEMVETWAPMRAAGQLNADEGFFAVSTNGSPFTAVVCGALIRAKHIYGEHVTVAADISWDEHWDREGTAVYEARDWVRTVFGVAHNPVE